MEASGRCGVWKGHMYMWPRVSLSAVTEGPLPPLFPSLSMGFSALGMLLLLTCVSFLVCDWEVRRERRVRGEPPLFSVR
jgi:hypothetical protein